MFKPLISAVLAASLLGAGANASATVTSDFGQYSVTYDETTLLGGISFNSGGSGNSVSFSWNFPTTSVSSTLGLNSASAALPEFTITPNAGYALSGVLTGFFGNLNYIEFAGGSTTAKVSGQISVNGGPSGLIEIDLLKTPINAFSGYYSASAIAPVGGFNSFRFFGGLITATANVPVAGGLASVSSQPQNLVSIGFTAAPVPEPEGYALMFAGLALVGAVMRRRARPGV